MTVGAAASQVVIGVDLAHSGYSEHRRPPLLGLIRTWDDAIVIGQATLLGCPGRCIRLAKDGNKGRLDVSIEHELVERNGVVLDESAVLEGLPGRMAVLLDALRELLQLLVLTHAIEVDRCEALGLDQGVKEAEHFIGALARVKGGARDVAGVERTATEY